MFEQRLSRRGFILGIVGAVCAGASVQTKAHEARRLKALLKLDEMYLVERTADARFIRVRGVDGRRIVDVPVANVALEWIDIDPVTGTTVPSVRNYFPRLVRLVAQREAVKI